MLSKCELTRVKNLIKGYLELNKGEAGLCGYLRSNLGGEVYHARYYPATEKWGRTWDKFSGCNIYPVPAPKGFKVPTDFWTKDAEEALYHITHQGNFLKGGYGELRKEYCLHLIKCIDEEIEKGLYHVI